MLASRFQSLVAVSLAVTTLFRQNAPQCPAADGTHGEAAAAGEEAHRSEGFDVQAAGQGESDETLVAQDRLFRCRTGFPGDGLTIEAELAEELLRALQGALLDLQRSGGVWGSGEKFSVT